MKFFTTPDFSLIEISPFTSADTAFWIAMAATFLFPIIGFIFQSKIFGKICIVLSGISIMFVFIMLVISMIDNPNEKDKLPDVQSFKEWISDTYIIELTDQQAENILLEQEPYASIEKGVNNIIYTTVTNSVHKKIQVALVYTENKAKEREWLLIDIPVPLLPTK